ncbi:MAG: alanine racemase [Piscirickettsiaceae bacterium]|nr:alanine racemase [Piscirickettsiaceae bacterium]
MHSSPTAKIDLNALQYNLSRVKEIAPRSKIMSVVKANAYGHGLIQSAQALSDSDAFAVARISEGVRLRQAGIQQPIVILEGAFSQTDFELASEHCLSLVFHQVAQIELFKILELATPLEFCWLMVETGMHRLGVAINNVDMALIALNQSPNISDTIGLMSHFANADERNDPRNQQQLDKILQLTEKHECTLSMANSAAILSIDDSHGDWVRPGLMLYGISPFEKSSAIDLGLKPVMTLTSTIITIQDLVEGEQVGYGGEFVADKPTRIATVAIGYGDGYSRQLSAVGTVLINNKITPVLGRVSMDMICIDISDIEAKIGDDVCLWGDKKLPVEIIAQQANTIPYELVCQISERVTRNYQHGES